MYIFVSWAYLSEAEAANSQREKLGNDYVIDLCLPEYAGFLQATANSENTDPGDSFNRNLLAVRFVIPWMERVATYQLSKRLPGTGKLPVSLAARAMLLNSFDGLWVGEKNVGTAESVKFVGLNNTEQFFEHFALACATLNEPLPFDLWRKTEIINLLSDQKARELLAACAVRCKDPTEAEKYNNLIKGWMGSGTSADRDSAIAVAAGLKLGLT